MTQPHRSIRQFTTEKLTDAEISDLIDVAQHTATSHYLQSMSVMHITDPHLRAAIAGISKQQYINQNGELFIFIADQYRASLSAAPGHHLGSFDKFLQAASDALLATQNVVTAAEAKGFGTVILGSILNDPKQLIDLLALPKFTFPICGLLVGHPDQTPQLKPRLPQATVFFENTYALPSDYDQQLAAYDDIIRDYYATRDTNRREETFSHLLAASAAVTPAKRSELFAAVKAQGFLSAGY